MPAGLFGQMCHARARARARRPGFPGFFRAGCPENLHPGYPGDILNTIKHSVPRWVVALLPKKSRYGDAFEVLCEVIGKIPSRELYGVYVYEVTIQGLVASTRQLTLSSSPAIPVYQPSPCASATGRQPFVPIAGSPSTPSVQAPIPVPFPLCPTQQATPCTPQVAFGTVTPIPNNPPMLHHTPGRQDPPHLNQPPLRPPTPLQPLGPGEHPLRDPFPTILPDTPEARTLWMARVASGKLGKPSWG
ncbi:hypothetical protein BDV93DRAFT_564734 [Ceratobasidium sp. AG-I]|nr:hypothetical protein BDV93DRAFT_564734 [Ceratobasidium sp. AG-I]